MSRSDLSTVINKIISAISEMAPEYFNNPLDSSVANGGAAACIIDADGNIYGKMFGPDKIRRRQSFKVAWTKCSQVWITGMKTGEYERKVFNNEIDHSKYGISMPDMIGWEGGQPITLKDGTVISAGFSGFRGTSDLEIVVKAVAKVDA